jgi:uncharacterized protein (DUF427 family)
MATATFNGTVIAQSDVTIMVEGNHYFPLSSVSADVLEATDHSTHCPWKGDSSYYDIVVDGERAGNAAWYYPAPKEKAAHIKDHIAFYPVVTVTTD